MTVEGHSDSVCDVVLEICGIVMEIKEKERLDRELELLAKQVMVFIYSARVNSEAFLPGGGRDSPHPEFRPPLAPHR